MYKISVIVPVYKSEKYLQTCLESIAAQTVFDKIQLILVDDGSSDGSGKICDDFAQKHKNTLVIHKENGGVSTARNAGLDKAEGEYIGFVDADDTVAPDYYEKLLNAAERNGCDMAFSSMTLIYKGERRVWPCWYPENTVLGKEEIVQNFAKKMLSDGRQNSACVKLLRHSIIKANGLRFPEGIKIGEDKYFVLEFLKHCTSAVCTGDCGYYYMDVGTSAMHSDSKMNELLATYDKETELFTELGLDLKTVQENKSVFLFGELADFLQRCCSSSAAQAAAAAKASFENKELMKKIDIGLPLVKASSGRIYNLLSSAFEKRSVHRTLLVLAVQNTITKIGERK